MLKFISIKPIFRSRVCALIHCRNYSIKIPRKAISIQRYFGRIFHKQNRFDHFNRKIKRAIHRQHQFSNWSAYPTFTAQQLRFSSLLVVKKCFFNIKARNTNTIVRLQLTLDDQRFTFKKHFSNIFFALTCVKISKKRRYLFEHMLQTHRRA